MPVLPEVIKAKVPVVTILPLESKVMPAPEPVKFSALASEEEETINPEVENRPERVRVEPLNFVLPDEPITPVVIMSSSPVSIFPKPVLIEPAPKIPT